MLNFPTSPTVGQEYAYGSRTWVWNGIGWALKAAVSYGSTDLVAEGNTNKYFTNDRARAAISVTQNLTYNAATGVLSGPDLSGYLTGASAATLFQQLDADLSAIAGLTGTGILKRTGSSTWALDTTAYENTANKNMANGYAGLDSTGTIPSSLLPSYVDDVLEFANLAAFPASGETGKIYVALATNKQYRWGGSSYIEISASPGSTDAVAEGSLNLYFTQARARASISVGQNLTYNSTTGVITGPDLTGYLTTSAAASTYAPLASPTFTGAIRGDLSNSTIGSRLLIQSNTANGNTGVVAIPNGTATTATWRAYSAADPDNASVAILGAFGATDVRVSSDKTGAGSYLPLTFFAGGSERARVAPTTGNMLIGGTTDNGTDKLQVNGSVSATTFKGTFANGTLSSYQEKVQSVGTVSTATYNIDLSLANIFDITLGANVAFTFTNPPASNFSKPVTIILRQDATGNRTASVTNAKYTDGITPVLSTGANQVDVLTYFTVNGGSFWFGTFAMANVS